MARKTRTQLDTEANIIKNETIVAANTATRVGTMYLADIESEVNWEDDVEHTLTNDALKVPASDAVFNAIGAIPTPNLQAVTDGVSNNETTNPLIVGVVGTQTIEYNNASIKHEVALLLNTTLQFVYPTGSGFINIPDVGNATETFALLSDLPNADISYTTDILKASLITLISSNLVEPKTMYRITNATGGVVRVWGVSINTISAAAFQEGSWDGTTLTGGAWGTYNLSTDTFTAISGGTLTASSFYTFIDSLTTIAAATVDNADYVSISDVSATLQKKISWSDFKIALKLSFDNTYQAILTATTMRTFVDSLNALTTPSDADRMLIVEDATSLAKKITYANIRAGINTNAVDLVTVKLSEAINKGQAVYISGADGTNILVSKASNTTEATSSKTIGLLQTSGALNAIVNIVTNGLLDGLNTSTATVGDPVYLGTSGNLIYGIANEPVAPAHLVYIGIVTRVSATVGEIFVNVINGFKLSEIHDVLITSVADKDVLQYESATTLWKNKALTTASVAASTDKNYVTDAQAVVIGNTSGTNSGNETTTTTGALINGATAKTTPISADCIGLMDSAASNILKKVSISDLKTVITDSFTVISFNGTWATPADSTTYYFPLMGGIATPLTTITSFLNTFTFAVKIVGICVQHLNAAGTVGSSENVSVGIRNNTDGTNNALINIQTTQANGVIKNFEDYSLNVDIPANKAIATYVSTPAWVTNPTNLGLRITLFIQKV